MQRKLRLGMIGCGEIAYTATAKSVQRCSNVEMVACADVVEHAARSFGETYGVPWSTRVEDVLQRPEVDAVVISTPHCTHSPLAIQAAQAGKHVASEKPIAATMEQADAMIAACRDAGVLLTVCLVTRYEPEAVRARELIQQGALGKITALHFHCSANKPESYWTGGYSGRVQTTWRKHKAEAAGGILIMNLVHDIDRLRYITGLEAVRVFSECDTFRTAVEVEDFVAVTLRYDNGALGSILAASCATGGEAQGNRIYGTEGQIHFGGPGLRVFTTRDVPGLKKGEWNEVEVTRVDSRALFLDRFAEAVFAGTPPEIPGEEGRKTLEVILAAYQSGEEHHPVELRR